MVMDIMIILEQDFDLKIHPREIFEQPSIERLAKYLAAEMDREQQQQASTADETVSRALAPWTRSKVRHFTQPGKRIPAIAFLLSSPRAGSTLLRVMLADHPALFCPPKLHLLPFDTFREREETLSQTYIDEGLQRAFMELKNFDADTSKAFIEDFAARAAHP